MNVHFAHISVFILKELRNYYLFLECAFVKLYELDNSDPGEGMMEDV